METSLSTLVSKIAQLAKEARLSKSIIPEEQVFFNWELDDFEYTETGVENTSAHGNETTKKYWFFASRKMSDEIVKSDEFLDVEKIITDEYQNINNPKYNLQIFCDLIIPIFLNNYKGKNKKAVSDIKKRFIRELNNEPINCYATFNVYGVVLKSKQIKITNDVLIRQTNKNDLEIPQRVEGGLSSNRLIQPYHSLVLKVDMSFVNNLTYNNSTFQIIADKYIALLRLFKMGSVFYSSYNMFSDGILPPFFAGTVTQTEKNNTSISPYLIKSRDEKKLRDFFTNFPLPKNIYNNFEKEVDHLTIAFDFYSETLLENISIERKIANSIMGLEALFSKDSIELSFRLSIRISKILSFFNKDSLKVKKDISSAYSIRSIFSHGEPWTKKNKDKIQEIYGSIDIFSNLIADYLRMGLIIMISSNMKKDEIIDLIDESLISNIKNNELKNKLKNVKTFINY